MQHKKWDIAKYPTNQKSKLETAQDNLREAANVPETTPINPTPINVKTTQTNAFGGWLCIDLKWIVINCHGCKDGEYPFGWFNVTLYKFHATTKIPNHVIFTKPVINR